MTARQMSVAEARRHVADAATRTADQTAAALAEAVAHHFNLPTGEVRAVIEATAPSDDVARKAVEGAAIGNDAWWLSRGHAN